MKLSIRTAAAVVLLSAGVLGVSVALFSGCRADFGGTGGSGDFLLTGETSSFFKAFQVDPRSEDSAGPQFVVAEDLNSDGLVDLVSAWNQSQPVQIHLQRRTSSGAVRFETVILAGNTPVIAVAGLAVADFDQDGAPDIAALLKQTMLDDAGCLEGDSPQDAEMSGLVLVYLGPSDADQVAQALAWSETPVEVSRLVGNSGSGESPEVGGFTSMTAGDMDLDGDMDLVVAWNSPCDEQVGTREALVFSNQGPGAVRDGTWTYTKIPNPAPLGLTIKDVALGDIDGDGDLDIAATFPDAGSMNVRWFRNPILDVPDDFHFSDGTWQVGTIAQIATQADVLRVGDLDRDGRVDVIVRSTNGNVIQWLKGAGSQSTTAPLPSLPWQVYTIAEFKDRSPRAIALGDLNSDGQLEVVASAGGALTWLDSEAAPSVYDQWTARLIVDDDPEGGGGLGSTDPGVTVEEVGGSTAINSVLVVDLDGDGRNDIVATLDRTGLSGLSNDALVWFRNTR
jgi:hypothetical protein